MFALIIHLHQLLVQLRFGIKTSWYEVDYMVFLLFLQCWIKHQPQTPNLLVSVFIVSIMVINKFYGKKKYFTFIWMLSSRSVNFVLSVSTLADRPIQIIMKIYAWCVKIDAITLMVCLLLSRRATWCEVQDKHACAYNAILLNILVCSWRDMWCTCVCATVCNQMNVPEIMWNKLWRLHMQITNL